MKRFCVLLLFFLAGCSSQNIFPKIPGIWEEDYVDHTVKYRGETPGVIALWYTGSHEAWHEIKRHNPWINERHMEIGDTVKIPTLLVERRDSFSKDEVRELRRAARSSSRQTLAYRSEVEVVSVRRASFSVPVVESEARFSIKSISGCQQYEDTLEGLDRCARAMEAEFQHVAPWP